MAASSSYKPQLDGVRAFAVAIVCISHWCAIEIGYAGVGIFFVMSGYLITGILLDARAKALTNGVSLVNVAKAFYVRRALRLVPAHSFYLTVLMAAGMMGDPNGAAWYFAYMGNFRMEQVNNWPMGVFHLWSLAVEEQFYLVVPIVCFMVSRNRILRVLAGLTGICVLFSWLTQAASEIYIMILPPAAFVGLLFGCVLAALERSDLADSGFVRFCELGSLPLMLVGQVGLSSFAVLASNYRFLFELTFYLGAVGMISLAADNKLGRWFEQPAAIFIGKISYGIYLWHIFAMDLIRNNYPEALEFRAPVQVMLTGVLTVAIATISFYSLERIFVSMKHRFPYVPVAPELTGPDRVPSESLEQTPARSNQPVDSGAHLMVHHTQAD